MINQLYDLKMLNSGFSEVKNHGKYPLEGTLYQVPEQFGKGYYWVYIEKDLFDIKIHDFSFIKDTVFELKENEWPECLNIAYYHSVSAEELMPKRHLTSGCIKTFFGGSSGFKGLFHKEIPLRSIGIEIFPNYYKKYLKEIYPNEYINPAIAFHSIDQTQNFPEMVNLLNQIWNYHEKGMPAKLFYNAKVAEAVSLIINRNKKEKTPENKLSAQDLLLMTNVANYIHEHFTCDISLEVLSKIACMGTTKLKSNFKMVYHRTITQYIKERRLCHAKTLLTTTNLSITQIALAVGYHNPGRFAATFKQSFGLYPAQYRKISVK